MYIHAHLQLRLLSITQLDPMLALKTSLSIITLITQQNRLLGTVRYVREQFGT